METVTEFIRRIGQGYTDPVLCATRAGTRYVAKTRLAGRDALVRERLGARNGRELGLPIPDVAQLMFEPSKAAFSTYEEASALAGFWRRHVFRRDRAALSDPAFRARVLPAMSRIIDRLPEFWAELPPEWLETPILRPAQVERVLRRCAAADVSRGLAEFRSLLRRRDGLVHFAEPGMVLADPREAVGQLYDRFVERGFARARDYQENEMRRRLGQLLREWQLRGWYTVNRVVGNDTFHQRFPFVHLRDERPVKAIKPLDLDKAEPTDVYEHGDAWVGRVRRLRQAGALPDRVVYPVLLPADGARRVAANDVCELLRRETADVVPFDAVDRIRELAARLTRGARGALTRRGRSGRGRRGSG